MNKTKRERERIFIEIIKRKLNIILYERAENDSEQPNLTT